MKITALRIENYRSIEDLSLQFPTFYTAICGKNDSGKTNILRALRVFSGEDDYYYSNIEISISEDFPKWRDKDARNKLICIEVELAVHKVSDEGLYAFLSEYLKLHEEPEYLHFSISLKFVTDSAKPDIGLTLGSASFDALKAEEVLKKLQTTQWLLFHNSPEFPSRYRSRYVEGLLGDLSASDAAQIDLLNKKLEKVAARVAKQNQNEVSELLGRLKDKYRIGLSAPPLDLNELPFSITVGTREAEIPLTSWGSGTQNRTRILMALFKAKRISEAAKSAAKVTPVIIIEEPESFLHPSAQAEFGAILRDLAEELRVQTIVATHSPYMLSLTEPKGNILLERDHSRGSLRATRRLDTSGEGWNLFPLRLVWTMNTSALGKTLFFGSSDCLLLVEGATDKEYFELLRDPGHGDRGLKFEGEIFPYGGKDTLQQKQLLKFIREKYKIFIVTYDLDVQCEIEPCLKDIGLVKGESYIAIGKQMAGKENIEGLLPESVTKAVFTDCSDLVQKALSGKRDEQKSAKSSLKKLFLEEFKRSASADSDHYKEFYLLAKQINKMVAAQLGR